MTEISDEGRKLAADLANAECSRAVWNAADFVAGEIYIALARLATQSIARDAELAGAKADLREIDRIAVRCAWLRLQGNLGRVSELAAKHRETDPLADALRSLPAEFAHCVDGADRLRAELAKRGIELKGVGA